MSLWSWVRALTEAKEKGMGHAPIACEWDHPSSEWARGWGPYKKRRLFFFFKAAGKSPKNIYIYTYFFSFSHYFQLLEKHQKYIHVFFFFSLFFLATGDTKKNTNPKFFFVRAPPPGSLQRGVVPYFTEYFGSIFSRTKVWF